MAKKNSGSLALRKSIYLEALEYFRCHPDEFSEDVLGIALNLYQKIMIRAFFKFSFLVWVMCRGTGKTFLGVLCLVVMVCCILTQNWG